MSDTELDHDVPAVGDDAAPESEEGGSASAKGILDVWQEQKTRMIRFWETHSESMERIAEELMQYLRECPDKDLPYLSYHPAHGLTKGDGLGAWEAVENPKLEQELRTLFDDPECVFQGAEPDVSRQWLDAEFCVFYRYLPVPDAEDLFCSLGLFYVADADYQFPYGFDVERLDGHWALLSEWLA